MIAKSEGVGVSAVQRMKVKFTDNVDYLMEYADDIRLLRDGLSLRKVRSKTGRALNTLRKLRRIFLI